MLVYNKVRLQQYSLFAFLLQFSVVKTDCLEHLKQAFKMSEMQESKEKYNHGPSSAVRIYPNDFPHL